MAAKHIMPMSEPASPSQPWPPAPPRVTGFAGKPELGLPMFDVLEAVGLGVWDWNLVTRRAYVSPSLKALYGYQPGEAFDLELDAVTHPEDLPAMHRDRQAHWDGLTPYYKNEHRVRHKAGHWIWVLTRGLVVARDAQGKPLRMTGFHVDITVRKQAELQHTLTRERLELALQGTHDGLWDWDLSNDKLYCSPRFMALLLYSDADEFNEVFTFRAHLHPDDVRRVTGLVRAHIDGQLPCFDAEYRLRCRDGSYRWFHGRGMVARNASGQAVRFAGHITDISDRIAADEAHQTLQVQLRESQKQEALGLLAGGVARDFSQLLGTVQSQLGALSAEPAGHPAWLARLGAIEQATQRADNLARQMLAFSRQQSQHRVVLDLCAVVAECLDTLEPTLPPGVVLQRQLASGPLKVLADAAQVCQLVGELWRNACQSFGVTGGTVQVRVVPDAMQHGATLVVKDDGRGMPPDVLARAFEPFFSTHSPGAGAGLGLPVVQALVLAHQGRVTLDSAPGRGAQVEVWLPTVAAMPPAPNPLPPVWVAAERASAPRGVAGGHIVYIDDYEAMVYLITRMLRKRGCRVSAFERAEDALALVRAHPADVDLLVTDYNMPGLSGLDVVRQVKAWRADLPVVITSGHVTPAMTAEALAEGVLLVLSKQDSVEAMADQLASVLAGLPKRE
jgi:PAS domain S-box-containing protein